MPMYGLFTSPILGMLAQTSALGSISQNISNMNTGGYKAHDTKFSTVLASTYSNSRDIGGLTANTRNFIEQQGRIISSTNGMDLAISGKGLYVLNTEVDGMGDTLYTRDGGFEIKSGAETTNGAGNIYNEGYIVDKNGYYLQGWVADGSGTVSTSGALQSIRVDSEAFNSGGAADATATASVAANLPATTAVGGSQSTKASIFDANGDTQTFELIWTRNATNQEWTMTVSPDSGTSTSTETFTFDSSGGLPDGTTTSVTVTDLNGAATTFTLDVSDVTSIGDQFLYFNFQKDGRTSGELDSFKFDAAGKVIGLFTNGLEQTLYKLPLATFVNGDGLDRIQGNLFQTSVTSGGPTLVEVRAENSSVDVFHEFAHFVPFSHELSNTNLQNEFSHMIMTQQAYNSAATVFKTVDEMTSQAANLKT
jgi:flagellar hook protein FlgE